MTQATAVAAPTPTAIPRWWPPALTVASILVLAASVEALILDRSGLARVGLVVLSSMLATASIAPTIWMAAHGQGRPRLITWGTWAMLTALAGSAAAIAGDYPAAAFSFVGTIATASVAIAAARFGLRDFDRVDGICLILVVLGGGLWLRLHEPWVAVVAACVIDCIGLVSTVRHIWHEPQEESAATYLLIALAGLIAVIAVVGQWPDGLPGLVTAAGYSTYVGFSMGFVAALCILRRRRVSAP